MLNSANDWNTSSEVHQNNCLNIAEIYPQKPITVFYDVTRLLARKDKPFATGIDRVDLEYFKQHINKSSITVKCVALVDNKIKRLDESIIKSYVDQLSQVWSGIRKSIDSSLYQQLSTKNYINSSRINRFKLKWLGNLSFDASQFQSNPANEVYYFNASHIGVLSLKPHLCNRFFQCLHASVVTYVHDIIPLTHSQYSTKAAQKKLKNYLENAINHRHTFIFNSEFTKNSFHQYFGLQDKNTRTFIQYPILNNPAQGEIRQFIIELSEHNYFLTVGTIEPRKNHYFLLKIWERAIHKEVLIKPSSSYRTRSGIQTNQQVMDSCLALQGSRVLQSMHGASDDRRNDAFQGFLNKRQSFPKLVIIGKRGWNNDKTFKLLDKLKAKSDSIIEINDASDAEVQFLTSNCQVVLLPSLIEGFNIPLMDSINLNTKVIASNIDVHKEIVDRFDLNSEALLLPFDQAVWEKGIFG